MEDYNATNRRNCTIYQAITSLINIIYRTYFDCSMKTLPGTHHSPTSNSRRKPAKFWSVRKRPDLTHPQNCDNIQYHYADDQSTANTHNSLSSDDIHFDCLEMQVDWREIVEILHHMVCRMRYGSDAFLQAIVLFKRIIKCQDAQLINPKLICACAFLICSKLFESRHVDLNSLVSYCAYQFTSAELVQAEETILKMLDFEVSLKESASVEEEIKKELKQIKMSANFYHGRIVQFYS